MQTNTLYVGVGKADILFTDDMFPNLGENYTHIHDLPQIQVLYLRSVQPFVLVACGLVLVSNSRQIRHEVAELFGVDESHVMIHAKHVLSTPHYGSREGAVTIESIMERARHMAHKELTLEEAETYLRRENLMNEAVLTAAISAAIAARDCIQPARIGIGRGYSEVNINRVIRTNKGWWQGANPDGITDRTVPVLRFDREDGTPLAILFNVNTAPGTLENSFLSDGRRPVSGDIASAAERYVDAEFKGAVSIYTTGATGDRWQTLRALFDTVDRNGNQTVTDLHEAGLLLMELSGKRLGQQIMKTAASIETHGLNSPLRLTYFEHNYPAQRVSVRENAGATTECEFFPDGETPAGYAILELDSTAVIFCDVEMGIRSYRNIKLCSPFMDTFLVEFSSVGSGGGYMVEQDLYEKMCYQSRKSRYAAGSAEIFCDNILNSLNKLKSV